MVVDVQVFEEGCGGFVGDEIDGDIDCIVGVQGMVVDGCQ